MNSISSVGMPLFSNFYFDIQITFVCVLVVKSYEKFFMKTFVVLFKTLWRSWNHSVRILKQWVLFPVFLFTLIIMGSPNTRDRQPTVRLTALCPVNSPQCPEYKPAFRTVNLWPVHCIIPSPPWILNLHKRELGFLFQSFAGPSPFNFWVLRSSRPKVNTETAGVNKNRVGCPRRLLPCFPLDCSLTQLASTW